MVLVLMLVLMLVDELLTGGSDLPILSKQKCVQLLSHSNN